MSHPIKCGLESPKAKSQLNLEIIIGSVHLIFRNNYYNFVGFSFLFKWVGEFSALLIMSRQISIISLSVFLHIFQDTVRLLNFIERYIHYSSLQMYYLACHSLFQCWVKQKTAVFLTEMETGRVAGNSVCRFQQISFIFFFLKVKDNYC